MEITFVLQNGEKVIHASVGETLLDVIQQNDIPVIGACGGAGVCGSCRVKIDSPFINIIPQPSDNELDMLEMFQSDDGVRLACQITLDEGCNGLRVILL